MQGPVGDERERDVCERSERERLERDLRGLRLERDLRETRENEGNLTVGMILQLVTGRFHGSASVRP